MHFTILNFLDYYAYYLRSYTMDKAIRLVFDVNMFRAPALCAHARNSDWLKLCARFIKCSYQS